MDLLINNTGSYESFQLLSAVTQNIENENMELMKVKNFETCRLCLTEIRDTNVTLLDGIIKDMLEIILPELNLSICETPAICKTCLETLKQSYNFKSSCLEVEDKVQDFVSPNSPSFIDLKEVLKKKNNIFQISENHLVCRTCLGLGNESNCTRLCSYVGDPLKNMVEKCLPEMGLNLTKDPVICPVCLEQLEEQFHFIIQCLDTEEKINYYCERKRTFKQIDLHSVYIFSMMDHEDVDKLYESVENTNSDRDYTAVPIQDNVNKNDVIKQQIQQEKENNSNSVAFVDLTKDALACNIKKDKLKKDQIENMNVEFFEHHRPTKEVEPPPPTEEVTFAVSKDHNGEEIITSQTSLIKNSNENDSDVSVTSEDYPLAVKFVRKLPVTAKNSKNGKDAKKIGESRKVEYKDDKDEDSGETSDDSSKPKKRLVTRKCKLCNFKTKYTSRMKAHRTVNHSGRKQESSPDGEITKKTKPDSHLTPKIKCRSCPYKTRDPEEYKKHKEEHKKEKEQKCHICGVVFIRPDFLKKHIENHSSKSTTQNKDSTKVNKESTAVNKEITKSKKVPQKSFAQFRGSSKSTQKYSFNFSGQFLKMYKCQICPYQTRMRSNLVKHSLSHKTTTEIKTHKCKICNFETIHKDNYLTHIQAHNNDSENQVKKCFLCSFQPKTEEALRQHVNLVHKSSTG